MMARPPDPFEMAAALMSPPEAVSQATIAKDIRARFTTVRQKQLPPPGDWFVWMILAGRGFGKTRTGASWIDAMARRGKRGDQVMIGGRTPSDVRDYSLNGEGGLLRHYPDIIYEPSKRLLTWPNGVTGLIRSGANPEEFRGFSGAAAWLDEFGAWDYPEECWYNLMFGVRERDPRICITTTPRVVPTLKEIKEAPTTVVVTGHSEENKENLSSKWIRAVLDPLKGTRLYRQEVEGELIEDVEGALWLREWIDDYRIKLADVPELLRVVVGVDPQGKKGKSRETGIVCSGVDTRTVRAHFYVLEDKSLSGTPKEWGAKVVAAYERNEADKIIGEVNYGGEMVEATVRAVNEDVPFEMVHATRGKQQRAEPISALYQQGRVHHIGTLPALEDEMCTWEPSNRSALSPNRVDALVWSLTKLSDPEPEPPKKYRTATWGR